MTTPQTPANLPADPAADAARAALVQMNEYYAYQAPVRADESRDAA